ncbi:glycosyltransferase family 2 protein [Candidatus Methylomicrobium oryzae]|jgi:GT2 family glycosyltransferase|uniref:glycosyltransferase family 2 protein n=1 Tax=Candidatus Methylomicrobium oryzae TaxID=2802053 RepID=UPI00192262AB|nr:glycosyltransferase family 2 protein [Methylomicrobium sp. RS1]MBL1265323.1 glycosyltransferase family 2 protein [Methylomicrobium sp. RS1]
MQTQFHDPLKNRSASVTVVIVNWNSGDLLGKCITQLLKQSLLPAHILVIDNASTDSSIEFNDSASNITIHKLNKNTGFASANNLALSQCNTEFVALLNPDAFPEPDWLKQLMAAATAHPDLASFGSRQMSYGLTKIIDGIGDVYHCSGLVWRHAHGRRQSDLEGISREIFSPCACAALYKREALQEISGFDEDYFCYVEDVDLGFRLRLAGYKAFYVSDAVVNHVGSATTGGQHSDFSIYHGHRNLVWTYIKNMPGILFWLFLPFHILLNLISVVYFSLQGKGKVIAQAKLDAIRGIPKMWQKRKTIQQTRKASIGEIWRALDKRMFPLRR